MQTLRAPHASLERVRAHLSEYLVTHPVKEGGDPRLYLQRSLLSRLFIHPKYMPAILILIITLTVGGGATVAASQNDLPTDALYGVKRAVERAQLTVTPQSSRAEVRATFAARRLQEVTLLKERGALTTELAVQTFTDMHAELTAAEKSFAKGTLEGEVGAERAARLEAAVQHLEGALERVEEKFEAGIDVDAAIDRLQLAIDTFEARVEHLREAAEDAEEVHEARSEAAVEMRAAAEGKIGAAAHRIEAVAKHVARLEAQGELRELARAKAELGAANDLLGEARTQFSAGAFLESFRVAQAALRTASHAAVLLKAPFVELEVNGAAAGTADVGALRARIHEEVKEEFEALKERREELIEEMREQLEEAREDEDEDDDGDDDENEVSTEAQVKSEGKMKVELGL